MLLISLIFKQLISHSLVVDNIRTTIINLNAELASHMKASKNIKSFLMTLLLKMDRLHPR